MATGATDLNRKPSGMTRPNTRSRVGVEHQDAGLVRPPGAKEGSSDLPRIASSTCPWPPAEAQVLCRHLLPAALHFVHPLSRIAEPCATSPLLVLLRRLTDPKHSRPANVALAAHGGPAVLQRHLFGLGNVSLISASKTICLHR